jgi:Na+/H+ antiporter NhaD/arsenite permease-like protein
MEGRSVKRVAALLGLLFVSAPAAAWASEGGAAGEHAAHIPPLWTVSFFVAMLLAIALIPLSRLHHWWESNLHKLYVALLLGAYPAYYYLTREPHQIGHVMIYEYVPFIVLLGSLFMISGGVRVTGDLRADPRTNSAFIAIGTLLASFIGTTGASMLLIRPLLQTNRERQYKVHTVIFFIFLVSNIGGSLLPIGDPPLFLGYLSGVPFFWTLKLWKIWLPTCCLLLVLYYFLDRAYYRRELPGARAWDRTALEPMRIAGARNFIWLGGVVASVIFMHQHSPIPLFRIPFLREVTMLVMVALAFATSPRRNWTDNRFTMGPIAEVAALFIGIFLTMVPALAILRARGGELGVDSPMKFFWGSGSLSSFLDNAPTYLVFFKAASGAVASGAMPALELVGNGVDKVPAHILMAISAGSVFMGANTYIGNGPNFMVKAIAEESGVRMPTFLGYMKWSVGFLIPTFILVSLIFFRGN